MLAAHFTQRIASTLARQLRELPDRTGQDMLATALHRLFHLDNPEVVETGPENQLIRRGTECLNLRKIATRKAT